MNQLTDEEVWLRAYCAALIADKVMYAMIWGDLAVEDFRKRFPNKASNKEDKT